MTGACPECASSWWQGVIKELVDVIHAWHDLAVAETCNSEDEHKRAAARKELNQKMINLNTSMCRGAEALGSTVDITDAKDAVSRARADTRACITASIVAADNKQPLIDLFTALASELDQNRNRMKELTDNHVSRGIATATRIFDAAVYSVRRVVDAMEKMSEHRNKACAIGRGVLGSKRNDCQAKCTAMRMSWDSMQSGLSEFLVEMYDKSGDAKIKQLGEAIFQSAKDLRGENDHVDCALRVSFFAHRVTDLIDALKEISLLSDGGDIEKENELLSQEASRVNSAIKNLQVETQRLISKENNQDLDKLDTDQAGTHGRILGDKVRASAAEARSTDLARARSAAHQIERDKKLNVAYKKAERYRDELEDIQTRNHVLGEKKQRVEALSSMRETISLKIKELAKFKEDTSVYADECMEISQREDSVTRSVDSDCTRHMCRVATDARRVFSLTVKRATSEFSGDTQELARRIQQEMQRFSRVAWRDIAAGRALVGSGKAPLEAMDVFEAMQAQNIAETRENETRYAGNMRHIDQLKGRVSTLVNDVMASED